MLLNFIIFFLQINIEENIKNAPDKDYEIGVVIGTYLPFILLEERAKISGKLVLSETTKSALLKFKK